jgi:hypothetical protein
LRRRQGEQTHENTAQKREQADVLRRRPAGLRIRAWGELFAERKATFSCGNHTPLEPEKRRLSGPIIDAFGWLREPGIKLKLRSLRYSAAEPEISTCLFVDDLIGCERSSCSIPQRSTKAFVGEAFCGSWSRRVQDRKVSFSVRCDIPRLAECDGTRYTRDLNRHKQQRSRTYTLHKLA